MSPNGSLILGLDAFTCENTGTTAAPVYVEITNVKDETINMESSLSDVTNRAANGWRLQVATLSDMTIDTQMIYKTADAEVENIRTAFFTKARILMGFFDGDPSEATAGTEVAGITGGFGVTNWSVGRALEEAMMVDVTFQVREDDAGNGPLWTKYTAAP